ncbi:ribosomal protection-like ABC-F family protein [Haloimpatiens massiliensis]|uniref:ribosomal protection-like ABC-F family protein n=1 Tax=Haloimpatiens massiliensis TaxID=1658110 RepID=UPI000C83F600|nr:ABC-F type ribosomal protection protein [Haloimpatiens massiliensis]
MMLIECANIKKYYGDRLILDIENLKIYSEDRIGVVGINGVGKTTLMNILCEKLQPDEGFIKSYGNISYISQLEASDQEEINQELASKFGITASWKEYMSGGEKTKFKLAQSLDSNSEIIFADEPTSNLDIESIKLLEEKFKSYHGALFIISHDREFLDRICNKILEIDRGKVKFYNGNYTEYKHKKEIEVKRCQFEYEKYQNEKQRLEDLIEKTEGRVKSIKKAPKRMGNSEARLHKMGNQKSKANLDRAIKNMKSRLEHLEIKERPKDVQKIKIDALSTNKLHSKILISGRNINKAFGEKTIFRDGDLNICNGSKTVLIGPNGSGKSTLINMIMRNDTYFKISPGVKIGYFSQSLDVLYDKLSIIENIMEECIYSETFARTLLARLLFKREDIYKKVGVLSGGERVKVSFAKIFLQDINLLILDEPTNYLDIYSMEALEEALKDYSRTILFVSHDRRFVSDLADHIISIENKKLVSFEGTYKEYIQNKTRKVKSFDKEREQKILLLQNKVSYLIGKLSMPDKKEDIEKLDKEYKKTIKELTMITKNS